MRVCTVAIVLVLAPVLPALPALAGDDAGFASQRARQLRVLAKPTAPQPVRLNAVDWLGKNIRDPDDTQVVAALDTVLKDDADAAVRVRAVEARAQLAMNGKRACPIGVMEAMLDGDLKVREMAINWSGVFPPDRYTQDAAPVLICCTQSPYAGVRSLAVLLLAQFPKHDANMIKAARHLAGDQALQVRTDAHAALFRMTGKFEDIVPYALQHLADRHDAARIQTGYMPPKEQAARNLITIGVTMRLRSLAEERTDELARYFVDSLTKGNAKLRRGVALYLADYYRGSDFVFGSATVTPKLPDFVLPYVEKDAKLPIAGNDQADQKKFEASVKQQALFRQRLREAGLEKVLRQVRDSDTDGLVRGAAAQALRQMEKRQKQEKMP